MRKLIALMISMLLLCTCTVMASGAEAKYTTAGDWYTACYDNLPDYVCAVWSRDGGSDNAIIFVQNTEEGEAGKQEILDLIEDDSSVSFRYGRFSQNYLRQIFDEVHIYFEQNIGLISSGISDRNNRIELEILENRKEDVDTQNAVLEITEKYGDAVYIYYVDERAIPVPATGDVSPTWQNLYAQFAPLFLMTAAFFLLGILLMVGKKKTLFAQRDDEN